MGWAKRGLMAGLFLSMLTVGCQNKMYDENKALYDENKALRDQNDRLRQQQALAQQSAAQPVPAPPPVPTPAPIVEPPPAIVEAPRPRPVEQIGGLETTVNKSGNTVVHLPSDVFFDSGQATLKQSSKASLEKVVSALNKKAYAGKRLIVEGHTDNQPIRVSKWSSNQELSVARADAVKQYLIAVGVDQDRISTKGFGDTKPRDTDRAKNRRVEIVVMTGSPE
jgi:flagellar motor protein MotB